MANSAVPAGLTVGEIIQYAKLDNAAKRIEPPRKALNEKLKQFFAKKGTFTYEQDEVSPNGEVHTVGAAVTIGDRTEFDATTAAADYPFEQYPVYYKPVLDKNTLPEEIRQQYETKGKTLSVKLISDIED